MVLKLKCAALKLDQNICVGSIATVTFLQNKGTDTCTRASKKLSYVIDDKGFVRAIHSFTLYLMCIVYLSFLHQKPVFKYSRFRYSFICQGTSTRRQRSDLFGVPSRGATCYYQSNHSKLEAISLSALLKEAKKASLPDYLHTISFLMLSVKQGSCDYHLLKSFGLTRPRNRT